MDYIRVELTRQRRALEALLTGGGDGDASRESPEARTVFSRRDGDGPRYEDPGQHSAWLAEGEAASRALEPLGAWEQVRRRASAPGGPAVPMPAGAPEHGAEPGSRRSAPPLPWETYRTAGGTGGVPDTEAPGAARTQEQFQDAERPARRSAGPSAAAVAVGGGGDTPLPAAAERSDWLLEGAFTASQAVRRETVEEPADMASVRTVSRAIQRDARRYDGGFPLY